MAGRSTPVCWPPRPQHGKVLIHTVGNDTRIDYTPAARYAGADAFSVRLMPGDAMIRVTGDRDAVIQ